VVPHHAALPHKCKYNFQLIVILIHSNITYTNVSLFLMQQRCHALLIKTLNQKNLPLIIKSIEWVVSGALHVPCLEQLILMDQGFFFILRWNKNKINK